MDLVIRDFVQSWFGDISADSSFHRCVWGQITGCLEVVVERTGGNRFDVAGIVVGQMMPLVTAHIRAIRAIRESQQKDDDVAREYMESTAMKWHPALESLRELDQRDKELEKRLVMEHVRKAMGLVIPLLLPQEQSTFGPHRVLVREILNGALLTPMLMSLSDPDTINQLLDTQLEKLIREQHMVNELREALDRQEDGLLGTEEEDDSLKHQTYDQFMETIDGCTDVRKLERIRQDILAQIRKRRILIMGQKNENIVHGQRVKDIVVYINRLYVARKKTERRLELVRMDQAASSGSMNSSAQSLPLPLPLPQSLIPADSQQYLSRASTYYDHRDDPTQLGPPQFSLREILNNVTSLSAFAEYMDIIGNSFILEFWVNVEGIRQQTTLDEMLPNILSSLWKTYFTVRVDELASLGDQTEDAISRVQRCLKPHRAEQGQMDLDPGRLTKEVCREAFELVCLVQEQVFGYMEQSILPPFLRSAFYSRYLREYCQTSREDQISAELFSEALREGEEGEDTVSLPTPEVASSRSIKVDRMEVRRLSASLRSIGGMDGDGPLAMTEYLEGEKEEEEEEEEEEVDLEEENEDEDKAESLMIARALKTPTPGDLFLDDRIRQLSDELERKTRQMAMVQALMRQAESRHKPHEQRVLEASYRDLRREVHAGVEQQKTYQSSLADHWLSATRTRVHIPRAIMASAREVGETDEKPHTVYLIELQQQLDSSSHAGGGGAAPTGWVVTRRYREFFNLHQQLKLRVPQLMSQLPARTPLIRLQKDRDIETRRRALEKYLQGLLSDERVCGERCLREFLSSTEPPMAADEGDEGWMQQIRKTVGEDIEGVTGADSMLEIIVQELGTQVAMQQPTAQVESTGAFIEPLSDLFIEVFGLKNRRNWLRRQAISILLRHIVGGTVERQVREMADRLLSDALLEGALGNLRRTLWPQDEKFRGFARRTEAQMRESKARARDQCLWYLPRLLGGMVGKKNARDGAQLLFGVAQHAVPNLNLLLQWFDVLVGVVFPEIKYQMEAIYSAT